MSTSLVLAIDAGTTGIRTILYDRRGREVASVYREFTQITPAQACSSTTRRDLGRHARPRGGDDGACRGGAGQLAAIGVTGQRATTLA